MDFFGKSLRLPFSEICEIKMQTFLILTYLVNFREHNSKNVGQFLRKIEFRRNTLQNLYKFTYN